jgi:DNA primase small subunit
VQGLSLTSHQEKRKRSIDRKEWLFQKLSAYYEKAKLELPDDINSREFAVQPIDYKGYVRHLSFKSEDELRSFLLKNPPMHLYYSSAIYTFPEIDDMEKKGMIGSEIIFDIDADEVPGCESIEQLHACLNCGSLLYGKSIKKCTKCGSQNVIEVEPIPKECILKAGIEAKKLIKVLRKDFGFEKIKIYFSGNRGFHVHPKCDDEWLKLTSEERSMIIKYITGSGVNIERIIGLGESIKGKNMYIPNPKEPGWRGRLGEILYKKMNLNDEKKITFGEAEVLLGEKINLNDIMKMASISIDEKVTVDVHRLIRIPGSINGKLGLPVFEIGESELESFSINCSYSPFKEDEDVKMNVSMQNKEILGIKINSLKGDIIKIPGCLAFLFISKGIADPA